MLEYKNKWAVTTIGQDYIPQMRRYMNAVLNISSELDLAYKLLKNSTNYSVFERKLDKASWEMEGLLKTSIVKSRRKDDDLSSGFEMLDSLREMQDVVSGYIKKFAKKEGVDSQMDAFSHALDRYIEVIKPHTLRYTEGEDNATRSLAKAISNSTSVPAYAHAAPAGEEKLSRQKKTKAINATKAQSEDLADKIFNAHKYLLEGKNRGYEEIALRGYDEIAMQNLSSVERYFLTSRLADLYEKSALDGKKRNEFNNSLESLVGFERNLSSIDYSTREQAKKNIALLRYAGIKKELSRYSFQGYAKELKGIVGEYAANIDFRNKFSGAGKNEISEGFDIYKYVYEKRLEEKNLKKISESAREKMIDYLTMNLAFSKESITLEERKAAIEMMIPKKNFLTSGTIRRMSETYKSALEKKNLSKEKDKGLIIILGSAGSKNMGIENIVRQAQEAASSAGKIPFNSVFEKINQASNN